MAQKKVANSVQKSSNHQKGGFSSMRAQLISTMANWLNKGGPVANKWDSGSPPRTMPKKKLAAHLCPRNAP
jgi:hypothetical protein